MSTTAPPVSMATRLATINENSSKVKKRVTSRWASFAAVIIAIVWTLPTFGLLVTSIRPQADIQSSGWWTFFSHPAFTLSNYKQVLDTQTSGTTLSQAFINSVIITLPAVVIPISLALLASYAFAWIDFKGRDFLFVLVFALQIVPLQVTLVPLLSIYVHLHMAGTFWPVWISHSIFALPLAVFLLHNFMKEIPRELIEAARVDGAGHVKIFFQVLMPLLTPAIAAFGIFQFLWVWNDLLVSITFASAPATSPLTVLLQNMVGTRGSSWYLLSAGAFIAIAVPLAVFISMQRFFVRGLLAGSVKG
jgi:alpha-glucoside transport system permease protein